MWETPVPIFEDEDEDELIARFVELSALYPKYSPFEVAGVVFKKLRDPQRAAQAAMIWSQDLDIKVRIDQAKLNGPANGELIASKEQWERKMLALLEDTTIGAQEKKVRLEVYNSIAKAKGWLDNPDDETGLGRRPIIVNYGLDPKSQAHAA